MLICIYVDDLIRIGSSTLMIDVFKQNMKKMFEMSDLGLIYVPFFGTRGEAGQQ